MHVITLIGPITEDRHRPVLHQELYDEATHQRRHRPAIILSRAVYIKVAKADHLYAKKLFVTPREQMVRCFGDRVKSLWSEITFGSRQLGAPFVARRRLNVNDPLHAGGARRFKN